jgi:hypothetical protein
MIRVLQQQYQARRLTAEQCRDLVHGWLWESMARRNAGRFATPSEDDAQDALFIYCWSVFKGAGPTAP